MWAARATSSGISVGVARTRRCRHLAFHSSLPALCTQFGTPQVLSRILPAGTACRHPRVKGWGRTLTHRVDKQGGPPQQPHSMRCQWVGRNRQQHPVSPFPHLPHHFVAVGEHRLNQYVLAGSSWSTCSSSPSRRPPLSCPSTAGCSLCASAPSSLLSFGQMWRLMLFIPPAHSLPPHDTSALATSTCVRDAAHLPSCLPPPAGHTEI